MANNASQRPEDALEQMRELMRKAEAEARGSPPPPPAPAEVPDGLYVQLPLDARKHIASALRAHARNYLYGNTLTRARLQHGERLRVYADLICPREEMRELREEERKEREASHGRP